MGAPELVLSVVGTLAGVLGTYFGYLGVRRTRRRPDPDPPAPPPASGAYDVFVAYGDDDRDWVREFARRLSAAGVRVAYDEVVARPGGVRVHSLEQGIRDAAHGLLVFGPTALAGGWVRQEYHALMQRSIETGRLFVPVLVGDVELPGFAATRFAADFRGVDEATYARRLDEIVRALRAS
ncbi:toll/interleukin-1 receptor domain-containing protein [Streptomyces hainanensis]|uniref:Toll/interleukin-1 receptor domain-containing protein n=1 Tax=Streptomyces hainanensis TaxID=402648 RepID=A0A4R4STB5_9ACTN|nr:toll/interleukin-1 receptor domain-containing protein [Streptomyces hainanensis]TDC65984.1 toll/interleukin-1 receptor domain-containing protein [Streptomyces hainanensis]